MVFRPDVLRQVLVREASLGLEELRLRPGAGCPGTVAGPGQGPAGPGQGPAGPPVGFPSPTFCLLQNARTLSGAAPGTRCVSSWVHYFNAKCKVGTGVSF